MNYFYKELNVKNFVFRDPSFCNKQKNILLILSKNYSNGIKFNLCIETHLNNIDEELSLMLKSAGVKLIYIGIESGVKKNKGQNHNQNFQRKTINK